MTDEVSIRHVARTLADIQASTSRTLAGGETGLAACYGFDEEAGPAANDGTASGRTCYLYPWEAWVLPTIPVLDAWANLRDALRITGGLAGASSADVTHLDTEPGGAVNISDAIRLAP